MFRFLAPVTVHQCWVQMMSSHVALFPLDLYLLEGFLDMSCFYLLKTTPLLSTMAILIYYSALGSSHRDLSFLIMTIWTIVSVVVGHPGFGLPDDWWYWGLLKICWSVVFVSCLSLWQNALERTQKAGKSSLAVLSGFMSHLAVESTAVFSPGGKKERPGFTGSSGVPPTA